ncbi:MAG TPA: hypothetical protein HPP94_05820 [Desulfuromonadales bacterium]|nr:hypothetical protein [Desulfuromonadales bacterium]
MKKTCCKLLCSAVLLSVPLPALAAEISVDASTLFGIGQRDVSGGKKESLLPATQFLGLDVDRLADGNLSLHTYGWGRADLADKSYNGKNEDGSLTYGYLQYRFKQANANIRAGRTFIHEGIVNEQLDGLSVRTDLPAGFGVSAFGGAVVHGKNLSGENSDGKGASLFGGRASYRYGSMLELGISGLYEAKAPTLNSYTHGSHRLTGIDLWLAPHKMVSLSGQSSYNPETKSVAEHSYLLTVTPLQQLIVSAEFNEYHSQNYFNSSALFTSKHMLTYNPSERSRSIGSSVSYQLTKELELVADYKHYSRQLGGADRYGAETRFTLTRPAYQSDSIRYGVGYHYLHAGQEFASAPYTTASYHELRGYLMHDTKGYFAALDALGFFFKGRKSAWEGTVSLGYHFTPALALSGDISYGKNPEFSDESKGLLRLTYNTTFAQNGVKK